MGGQSLSEVLAPALAELPAQERAFAQELCYGTLRWGPRLAAIADRLLRKPVRERDHDLRALLWVGLYQLLYCRVPSYAAVDSTVAATRALQKPWAAGLVNAVMRGFLTRRDALLAEVDRDEPAVTAHPLWWLRALQLGRPDDWRAIIAANNERPPMTLRVNARRARRDAYLTTLVQADLAGRPAPHTDCGIVLAQPAEVAQLPGFKDGLVSVQDGSAQLAAVLLDPQPGDRILDACAAPGGKTAHLLERQPALAEVVAVDKDAGRMVRVQENLARLGLAARCVVADAAAADWWDGQLFDRILLDAPCSGSGVIRRHPDIKYLRRPDDVAVLARGQSRLLAALWPLLKHGGMLLYAVCSILPDENERQVEAFLAQHRDAWEELPAVTWGRPLSPGRLIVSGTEGMDGFYYACLRKN